MKLLYAALGLLALGASTASAQYYDPRERRERGEYRYEERRRYGGEDCGAVRRSIYDLERMLRNGQAGGGTRAALGEARAKYYRSCR